MTYINLVLGLVFLVFLGRYLFSLYKEGMYRPEEWAWYLSKGKISPELRREYKRYRDKIRFFSWWLQVERIKKQQVPGAFAELGVYKGDSARIIHLIDPSRIFHLFDTFEGFTAKDLKKEKGEASAYTEKNFADTSLAAIKDLLGNNKKFIFHPGYFPETASGLEKEKFALVNIDADLYNPIKAGLEFFYPRLSPGGVIFIHDYNYKWDGCRRAVDEYTASIPETPVFLPDRDGTVVIVKGS